MAPQLAFVHGSFARPDRLQYSESVEVSLCTAGSVFGGRYGSLHTSEGGGGMWVAQELVRSYSTMHYETIGCIQSRSEIHASRCDYNNRLSTTIMYCLSLQCRDAD
jgi:hypothetical protein